MAVSTDIHIQHDGPIFAIAVSPDERMLACGGRGEVSLTIWDLATGVLLKRLAGVVGDVQSLAFSLDCTTIAAATVWGGIWVWDVQRGDLLHHKPPTKSRRTRLLYFPARYKPPALPKLCSSSLFSGTPEAISPDGALLAEGAVLVRVTKYKSDLDIARLDLTRYDISNVAVRYLAWAGDSSMLALCAARWVGLWLPIPHTFFMRELPFTEVVYGIAVIKSPLRVVCAM